MVPSPPVSPSRNQQATPGHAPNQRQVWKKWVGRTLRGGQVSRPPQDALTCYEVGQDPSNVPFLPTCSNCAAWSDAKSNNVPRLRGIHRQKDAGRRYQCMHLLVPATPPCHKCSPAGTPLSAPGSSPRRQICKMICMAIEVVRGASSMNTLELAMSKDNSTIQVGLAPAQGLYLEMSYYAGYNRRKQINAELHDIEWEREDLPAHARWKEFRNGSVMKHVVDEEEREGNFVKFLFLQEYFYDRDRAYDPTKEKLHNQWRLLDSEESIGDDCES